MKAPGMIDITRYLLEKGADKNKGESPECHAHNLSFDHTSFWKRLKYKRIANLIANHNTETMISDIWNSLNP